MTGFLSSYWLVSKQENGGGDIGLSFKLGGLWAPLAPKVQMVRNIICGSRMRSTKKRKLIVEKSSFPKVYFSHDPKILKIAHRFRCEKPVLSFLPKNEISKFRTRMEGT